MTASVEDLDRMMRANHHTGCREDCRYTHMEVMWGSFEREDILGALDNQVVTEEHPAKNERRMSASKAINLKQETLRDSIAGIPWLIEESVTASVIPKSHNVVKKEDNCLQGMLQGLVYNGLHYKLGSIQFEAGRLQGIKEAMKSRLPGKKVTEDMLGNNEIIASVASFIEKETRKSVDARCYG